MPRDLFENDNQVAPNENVKRQPRDLFEQSEPEDFNTSARLAIPRIATDLAKKAYGGIQKIPNYWEKAKTEVPAYLNPLNGLRHPIETTKQSIAGLLEAGEGINHLPRKAVNYAANRLNLLPKSWTNKVPVAPSLEQDIEKYIGNPKNPGDTLARGVGRNVLNIATGAEIGSVLNPANLTHSGIARNVVNELHRQEAGHTHMYNNLWRAAEQHGIRDVPISQHLIDNNLAFIRQYKSPREYGGLEQFRHHPTLQNAQAATSDLKGIMRGLHEKSKQSSLTSEERHLYDAADHTVRHIEGNMFLNPNGTVNQPLADLHRGINTSYRENVVPYKYNKAIQDFIDRKKTPKELVNSLSGGEFAVKKGRRHPAIKIRNNFPAAVTGLGTFGGLGWLLNEALGDNNKR